MITLHQKPLSLNQMYPTGRNGRRFATAESKSYKESWALLAKAHYREFTGYTLPLAVAIEVVGPITTKAGSISKTAIDLDNCAKPIIDGVADALGFNDSIVTMLICRKHYAERWAITVAIKPDDSISSTTLESISHHE
jgi:Holliday junction resolvase RusA-like endonuclease